MRYPLLAILVFLLVSTSNAAQTVEKGWADIYDSKGTKVGWAVLTESPYGVAISIQVRGLPPGNHGIHIHAVGECKMPDFTSAGGHFNPYRKHHGRKNPAGRHAGDLPNLLVSSNGTAKAALTIPNVTLGPGKGSLFPDSGTSIVIHAKQDDELTDPAGNSGERIACGVITR